IDWNEAARLGRSLAPNDPIPPELLQRLWQLAYLGSELGLDGTIQKYDPVIFSQIAPQLFGPLPGSNRDAAEFAPEHLARRVEKVINDPTINAAFDVFSPRMTSILRVAKIQMARELQKRGFKVVGELPPPTEAESKLPIASNPYFRIGGDTSPPKT